MSFGKILRKPAFYGNLFWIALSAGAVGTLFDFLLYRVLGARWARRKGHTFHRSTLFWFKEGEGVHTRAVFLLPRLQSRFAGLKTVDMTLEFYDEDGRKTADFDAGGLNAGDCYLLESDRLPAGFHIPSPFSGTLIAKFRLPLDEKLIFKTQHGLFASMPVYIDYYSEGTFVTTLHDYSAFLPDQGINPTALAMIPAYCDDAKETFLILHSAQAGIGPRDLRVRLYNREGRYRQARMPALRPFAFRRVPLTELFPGAKEFLGGQIGQVRIDGFFRQLLRRTAYGIRYAGSAAFSMDHCFYADWGAKAAPPAATRRSKSIFSPFAVVENEHVSSSAILYQSDRESQHRDVGLLVYDSAGKCVAEVPRHVYLKGNRVERISMREVLKEARVALPFVGHVELLFHPDAGSSEAPVFFEHAAEYDVGGKLAHVIHGADFWNPPAEVPGNPHVSAYRIVCNDAQTTIVAISNCSYDYDYRLEASFKITLYANGRELTSGRFHIGPNATIYEPIEYFFSNSREILQPYRGVALATTTETNCKYLTHSFLTQDRRSRTLSVEHSLGL